MTVWFQGHHSTCLLLVRTIESRDDALRRSFDREIPLEAGKHDAYVIQWMCITHFIYPNFFEMFNFAHEFPKPFLTLWLCLVVPEQTRRSTVTLRARASSVLTSEPKVLSSSSASFVSQLVHVYEAVKFRRVSRRAWASPHVSCIHTGSTVFLRSRGQPPACPTGCAAQLTLTCRSTTVTRYARVASREIAETAAAEKAMRCVEMQHSPSHCFTSPES